MKKTLFSTLVVLSLVPVTAYAALKDAAKIAVASDGKETTASISNTAKAHYYLMFNEKGELIEAIPNPYKDSKEDSVSLTAEKGNLYFLLLKRDPTKWRYCFYRRPARKAGAP